MLHHHHHQHSQKVPLLPLQGEGAPLEPDAFACDHDLLHSSISKQHWSSAPWARRLGGFAERSSYGLVPTLVGLPLFVSIFAHVYFQMFSTLHIFLAIVWIGLPVATISTFVTLASRSLSNRSCNSSTRSDKIKTIVLLALTCTVAWRTFTVSPRRGLSDFSSASANNETVYIAANLYNSEHLFPAFSDSLLELVDHLGRDNVYVSIYESNSDDRTKQLLSLLEHDLQLRGVQNSIRMLDNNRRHDMDRIERLAIIRNEALNPIQAGVHGLHGRTFSKVIWLNDIFFRPGKSSLRHLAAHCGHDLTCELTRFLYLPCLADRPQSPFLNSLQRTRVTLTRFARSTICH